MGGAGVTTGSCRGGRCQTGSVARNVPTGDLDGVTQAIKVANVAAERCFCALSQTLGVNQSVVGQGADVCAVLAGKPPQFAHGQVQRRQQAYVQNVGVHAGQGDVNNCRWRLEGMDKAAIIAVMKTFSALEAKNRFGEMIEAAQRQPVGITRNGRPSVVVISAESYARRQRLARERLRGALLRAGEHAARQGLTEEALQQLLVDES